LHTERSQAVSSFIAAHRDGTRGFPEAVGNEHGHFSFPNQTEPAGAKRPGRLSSRSYGDVTAGSCRSTRLIVASTHGTCKQKTH
jgi:hypothetical protein